MNYGKMADCIVGALKLQAGERVLIRFDPGFFRELVGPLRRRIRDAGGVDLAALEYVETAAVRDAASSREQSETHSRAFEQLLDAADVYLWLPLRAEEREIPPPEAKALQRWLDRGGTRRQIHFHWSAGSVLPDGLPGAHSPALDEIYQGALEIDHATLSARQERFVRLLRAGTVRVRTPRGTDLRFRIGDRPFNRQDGDASSQRARRGVVRIDREIELPAGVLRVAPLEQTVNGRIVVPEARFGEEKARGIRLEIEDGRVIRVEADEGHAVVEAAMAAGGDAARRFREFGLGFNPGLIPPEGSPILPYFGYGAGVVRLSLGDNEELGGAVRGEFVRWFFFPDASVEVEGRVLVRNGNMLDP